MRQLFDTGATLRCCGSSETVWPDGKPAVRIAFTGIGVGDTQLTLTVDYAHSDKFVVGREYLVLLELPAAPKESSG